MFLCSTTRREASPGWSPPGAGTDPGLVEALTALISKGASTHRGDPHGSAQRAVCAPPRNGAGRIGLGDRLLVRMDDEERLHEKGLLGDDYYLQDR